MRDGRQPSLIILTGLSGAGKTVALNALEDNNYFCVDNLPTSLLKTFVHLCNRSPFIPNIAIGADIRERRFSTKFAVDISSLKEHINAEIIFLEADDDVLIRRYKETRRPHPLGYRDLRKALREERKILKPIRDMADRIIDTTTLTPHQLRDTIIKMSSPRKEKGMSISLISFGYKYGAPSEADLLFDVRFLPNPNFISELKPYDGTTKKIKNFLFNKKETKQFIKKLTSLLDFLLPKYMAEGRSYLTIGIGCTGGRHRSPAIVEEITRYLKSKDLKVNVVHRDMRG
jgi:UPF0042 nucleotide-binding protein